MTESPKADPYPVQRLSRIEPPHPDAPIWLVEGLWTAAGVGFLGGLPKQGKTWLALEIAVAVASGRPCLGRYAVPNPGPVLVHCVEDGPQAVRARVAGLCRARNLNFDRLPIGWLDASPLRLDRPGDQLRLEATIAWSKARLLVLDPLVRLHAGDENAVADISRLLSFLRALQRAHGVAILIVHHVRKASSSEPGQALRGSGDLHSWGDSNLYVLPTADGKQLVGEHRSHPAPTPLLVALEGDPPRLVIQSGA